MSLSYVCLCSLIQYEHVCMCLPIPVCTCAHTTSTKACLWSQRHVVLKHTYTRAHTHTCVHTRTRTHAHAYLQTHMRTHTYTHICAHTRTYTRTHAHVHVHIQVHSLPSFPGWEGCSSRGQRRCFHLDSRCSRPPLSCQAPLPSHRSCPSSV
jgi:hypothetical protein